jgi:hypothetical protein
MRDQDDPFSRVGAHEFHHIAAGAGLEFSMGFATSRAHIEIIGFETRESFGRAGHDLFAGEPGPFAYIDLPKAWIRLWSEAERAREHAGSFMCAFEVAAKDARDSLAREFPLELAGEPPRLSPAER